MLIFLAMCVAGTAVGVASIFPLSTLYGPNDYSVLGLFVICPLAGFIVGATAAVVVLWRRRHRG